MLTFTPFSTFNFHLMRLHSYLYSCQSYFSNKIINMFFQIKPILLAIIIMMILSFFIISFSKCNSTFIPSVSSLWTPFLLILDPPLIFNSSFKYLRKCYYVSTESTPSQVTVTSVQLLIGPISQMMANTVNNMAWQWLPYSHNVQLRTVTDTNIFDV